MQVEKTIKPEVDVLCIKPKEVDTFWPLVEFLIAEALKFSGQYADAKHIKQLRDTHFKYIFTENRYKNT